MTGAAPKLDRMDIAAAGVAAAGLLYVLFGSPLWTPSGPAVEPPRVVVESLPSGRKAARIDYLAWRDACRAVDLPDPPTLDGSEPIAIEGLFDTFADWSETRDVTSLGRLGQIYLGNESHTPALECFIAAHHLDPENALWAYLLGVECQQFGYVDPAIEYLELARSMDPGYPTTYGRLGRLYLERGELELAEARYAEARDRHPIASFGLVGLGRVALAQGETARAREFFQQAVDATRRDFVAHRLLAQTHAALGDDALARRHGDIARSLPVYSGWLTFDDRLRAARRIANTYGYFEQELRRCLTGGVQELRVAPALCRQMIERRPDDHATRAVLARVCLRLSEFAAQAGDQLQAASYLEEASNAIDGALLVKPDAAPAHYVKATIAFRRGDRPATLAAIDDVFAFVPDHAGAVSLQARTVYLEGDRERGIELMRRAKGLDPTNGSTRLTLAIFYRQTSRSDDAIAELEELIALAPNTTEAARAAVFLEEIRAGTSTDG